MWGRNAKHLDPERAEATADLQPEHRAVEADGLFEIAAARLNFALYPSRDRPWIRTNFMRPEAPLLMDTADLRHWK